MAKNKDKKSKKEQAEQMLQYTYRDSGQEFIMKRKMIRAILFMLMSIIALVVFIALYIGETYRVQETYRSQFDKALDSAIQQVQEYEDADGNFERRYRMIFAEITNLNTFSFLIKDKTEEHKRINELYTVFLMYPEQTASRMGEIEKLLEDIKSSEKDAYDNLKQFIESIDKKGK